METQKTDWKALEQAQEERWVEEGPYGLMKCTFHDLLFFQAQGCKHCFEEFTVR